MKRSLNQMNDELLSKTLFHFLQVILKILLFGDIDANITEFAAQALFSLICAQPVLSIHFFFFPFPPLTLVFSFKN